MLILKFLAKQIHSKKERKRSRDNQISSLLDLVLDFEFELDCDEYERTNLRTE